MQTCINKVELLGTIGSIRNTPDRVDFSLVTTRIYKGKDNNPVLEETWHHCTAPKNLLKKEEVELSAGQNIHLRGFIRNLRYENGDGISMFQTTVVATELEEA